MVGPLAHMLKNRFYIGDVVYEGEVNPGEHEPILDRELFEAVQARMAEKRVLRQQARAQSQAILMGQIFDDRGNPMTPSHANKKGVRYRYYVSHALLQNRKDAAGSIGRVSAPDVETLIVAAIRNELTPRNEIADGDLIKEYVQRIIIHATQIEIAIQKASTNHAPHELSILTIPFTPTQPSKKGITHSPALSASIDQETQDTLLKAIARARDWMEVLVSGEATSTDEIASTENLAERHVRFLLPLAYLSPRIVAAIANATAPAGLTVSSLARALPHNWSHQDRILESA